MKRVAYHSDLTVVNQTSCKKVYSSLTQSPLGPLVLPIECSLRESHANVMDDVPHVTSKRPRSPSLDIPYDPTAVFVLSRPSVAILPDRQEEWRSVPGVDGVIVSSEGRIQRTTGTHCREPFIPNQNKQGYRQFFILGRCFGVHHCVCLAFLGSPPSSMHTADHISRDRGDNRLENLRWASKADQNRNRDRGPHSDGKPVFLWHKSWSEYDPPLWIHSTYAAANLIGANTGLVFKQLTHETTLAWRLSYAPPAESQDDLLDEYTGELEQWKEFNPKLRVSSMGRTQVRKKVEWGWGYKRTPIPGKGSVYVTVGTAGGRCLHPIVCDLFCRPRLPGEHQTDHIDGDTSNNKASNLVPITIKGNSLKRVLKPMTERQNSQKKIVISYAPDGTTERHNGINQMRRDIELRDNVRLNAGNVSSCLTGRAKTCLGYKFSYA